MNEVLSDYGQQTWLPVTVIAVRLLVAILLGAIVGLEREWRQHPAGLRTHILVCLAAATVAILTIEIAKSDVFAGESIRVDPLRLIEAVTGGVAFLAAGLIVFARGEVRGLTTGAGLWLAGAIGLAAGLGYWAVAGLATLLGVIILSALRAVEAFLTLNENDRLRPKREKPGGPARPE